MRRIDVAEVACWRVSRYCNRACPFCLSSSGPGRRHRDQNPDNVLRRLHELGFLKVSYTGGEPLAYPALPDILSAGQRHGLAQVLTTNGDMLFDQPIPAWLHDLEHLRLSFYGDREAHDALMGHGHYDQNLSLAQRLRDADISVSFNYMLSAMSQSGLQAFLQEAARVQAYHVVLQTYIQTRRRQVDAKFTITDIDSAIAHARLIARLTPSLQGGVRVHDFRENDWLIVLDDDARLWLPSNDASPDHLLGGLFDHELNPYDGSAPRPAAEVLSMVWDIHRAGASVIRFEQ